MLFLQGVAVPRLFFLVIFLPVLVYEMLSQMNLTTSMSTMLHFLLALHWHCIKFRQIQEALGSLHRVSLPV